MASSVVSLTGNAFTLIALPWYVLETTGSAARTGLVAFMGAWPLILSAVLGGAIIDRVGQRRVIIVADLLSGLTVGAIPLLASLDLLSFPLLLALVAAGAFLDAPGNTARQALLPDAARDAGVSLDKANSFFMTAFSSAQVLGPAVGGVVVASIGAAGAIWFNALAFALSLLIIWLTIPPRMEQPDLTSTSYLENLKEGLRFVWRERFIRAMVLVGAAFTFVFAPLYGVIFPVFFERTFESARAFGFFLAADGLGMALGALGYGLIGSRGVSRRLILIASILLYCPTLWLIVLQPPLPVILLAGFLGGFITGPINPIIGVALQVRTPETLRGRVIGAMGSVSMSSAPVGALLAGPLVEWLGPVRVIGLIAALVSLLAVAMIWVREFRELDDPSFDAVAGHSTPGVLKFEPADEPSLP